MRRLYFLSPHVNSAKQIVNDLLLARVDAGHMHIISKDESQLTAADLPGASLLEKSDVIPALERGLVFGLATGLVAGLIGASFSPLGLEFDGATILGITLAGAVFGTWVSGMIGVSLHNSKLKRFEPAIDEGQLLLIVDVPKGRIEEITQLVKRHHPEAGERGSEPTMPAFP
jgi:uncharacterized membrane protein YeaQ/YmgE (transglycosylase-associated protein family)